MMTPAIPAPLRWIPISGGVCLFGDDARPRRVGDLLVTATPITRAQAGLDGPPDLPVTGIDFARASSLAHDLDGRLPKSLEWEWIAAGPTQRRFPWGDAAWEPRLARLRGQTPHDGPGDVAGHPDGRTPEGVLDLAGNVWEWTASPVMGNGRVIRGGSFASKPLYSRCTFLNAVHAERRSSGIGIRVVKTA